MHDHYAALEEQRVDAVGAHICNKFDKIIDEVSPVTEVNVQNLPAEGQFTVDSI